MKSRIWFISGEIANGATSKIKIDSVNPVVPQIGSMLDFASNESGYSVSGKVTHVHYGYYNDSEFDVVIYVYTE